MTTPSKPVANDTLIEQLQWRYATKVFDPTRKIPTEDWATLEQALLLSASSYGLQPWKFIVVTDQAVKEKLMPVCWNQRQLVDASHVVVFTIKKHLGLRDVEDYMARIAEVRGVPIDALAGFRDFILGDLVNGRRSLDINGWSARQVYLALGNFLTCAALLGIDVCPMEGFEPDKVDQLLELPRRGLASVVMCTAGYRSDDDKYASLAKVRFEAKDVFERV